MCGRIRREEREEENVVIKIQSHKLKLNLKINIYIYIYLDVVACTFNPTPGGSLWTLKLCEFEVSLVDIVSSGSARATIARSYLSKK